MSYDIYSQAIKAAALIFVSDVLGLDTETGDFTSNDVAGQTEKILENMKLILEAGASSLPQIVKTTILLQDINDAHKVNEVYAKYFPVDPPTNTMYAVTGLPKNALVEISAVAIYNAPKK
eukprot:Phypoly_transcript_22007.p1 GENE.Phypoly_transcript_22007~~Phypoly_transcript_22007.p1  ORF type:complete len:120 (+),score=15.85 Phypoly_transcript_22007:175-534(+)